MDRRGQEASHAGASLPEEVHARTREFWRFLGEDLGRKELLPGREGRGRLGYRVELPAFLTPEGTLPFSLHVIGLDSAWLAGDDDDAGKLRLTEEQAKLLLREKEGTPLPGFRLGLIHHAPGLLADHSQSREWLEGGVDLLLCGHEHDPVAHAYLEDKRPFFVYGAGALYEAQDAHWENSFQLLTVTLDDDGHLLSLKRDKWTWAACSWIEQGTGPVPPPPVLPKTVFVGRDEELARLEDALLLGLGTAGDVALCNVHGMAGGEELAC